MMKHLKIALYMIEHSSEMYCESPKGPDGTNLPELHLSSTTRVKGMRPHRPSFVRRSLAAAWYNDFALV